MPHYLLTADYVCHDVKQTGTATLTVERDTAPTSEEAEALLWPRLNEIVWGPDGVGYPADIQRVTIREISASASSPDA